MSSDPAVEALIADGTWNASPLGACGVRRMVRGRVAEGLVRLVREADAAVIRHVCGDDCSAPVRATDPVRAKREKAARAVLYRAIAALAADREPEPGEAEPSVDAILRCLDRAYHPQVGFNPTHPLDTLTSAKVVTPERVAAALSEPPPEGESE